MIPGSAWALQNSTAVPPPVRRSFFAHLAANQKLLAGVRGSGAAIKQHWPEFCQMGVNQPLTTPATLILCMRANAALLPN